MKNDADQTNEELNQNAKNEAFAFVFNKNVNFNPQFTLLGSNSSSNNQSNSTSIDQSQNVKAAQVNVAGQAIHVGPPIDPVNDADQSNGTLNQKAKNEPEAVVGQQERELQPAVHARRQQQLGQHPVEQHVDRPEPERGSTPAQRCSADDRSGLS